MSFYMSFDERENDNRRIQGGSMSGGDFDQSEIKASLDSIRAENKMAQPSAESKPGAKSDLIDAAKVGLPTCLYLVRQITLRCVACRGLRSRNTLQ